MGTGHRREGENLAQCLVSSGGRRAQSFHRATQDRQVPSPVNSDLSTYVLYGTELTEYCMSVCSLHVCVYASTYVRIYAVFSQVYIHMLVNTYGT